MNNINHFHFKNNWRVWTNWAYTLLFISDIRRDNQYNFRSFVHQLQAFIPTWYYFTLANRDTDRRVLTTWLHRLFFFNSYFFYTGFKYFTIWKSACVIYNSGIAK